MCHDSRARWPLCYTVLAFALCAPVLRCGFLAEDAIWLFDARSLHSLFGAHPTAFAPLDGVRLSPTEVLFFYVGLHLGGLQPWVFHCGVALLTACNAFLLHLWVRDLTASTLAAAIAALTFLVMPVHGEALAWLSAVNEPLLGLFSMLALLHWRRWRADGRPRTLALALLAFSAALLTKISAVGLPAILLASDLILQTPRRVKLQLPPPDRDSPPPPPDRKPHQPPPDRKPHQPPPDREPHQLPPDLQSHLALWAITALVIAWARLSLPDSSAIDGALGRPLSLLLALPLWLVACAAVARRNRPVAFHLAWMALAIAPYLLVASPADMNPRYLWTASLALGGLLGCVAAAGLSKPRVLLGAAIVLWVALLPRLLSAERRYARPDDTALLRAQVVAQLSGRAPTGRVFVYQPMPAEHTNGRLVALLADLDEADIRDWYEDGLREGDVMLFWDESNHRFLDLTTVVRPWKTPNVVNTGDVPDPARAVKTWDLHVPAERAQWTPRGATQPSADRPVYETRQPSDALIGPPLALSPFAVGRVEIEAHPLAGQNEKLFPHLAWDSPHDKTPSAGRTAPRSPHARQYANGALRIVFTPADRLQWWTEEGATRLSIALSAAAPARVEIDRITIFAPR